MPGDQNSGLNENIQISNKPFERVEQFNCLGITLTNQISIREEIKSGILVVIRCRIFCLPV